MQVNERIRKLRKALDLTQIEFGKKIGVAQGHLTGIENGKKSVTEKTLKVICAVYGASENWMKNGAGEMFARAPREKIDRITQFFSELNKDYQNFVLNQMDALLELQYRRDSAKTKKRTTK